MAYHSVSFPLQAPGERAGELLADLEHQLEADVGLGSDAIVTVSVAAESAEEARDRVVEAIHSVHADGYFDLSELREPMGVSVIRYRVGAGSVGDLGRLVAEGFAAILSEAPGFIAYHLVETGQYEVTSIKIFSDRQSLNASEALAADWVKQNLGRFRLRRVDESEGSVLASRRAR